MKVQHLIKQLEQMPWDAEVIGVMSDEVGVGWNEEQAFFFVPECAGYKADVFFDNKNKQAVIELG